MTDVTTHREPWADWPAWDLRVLDAADGRALLVATAGGIAFDAGARSGVVTVGGWLAVAVAGVGLVASGRLRTAASRVCVGSAVVLAGFLAIRTSEWLVALNLVGIAGLLVLAGVLARDGRMADLSARLLASRALTAVAHGLASSAFLLAPVGTWLGRRPHRGASLGPVARGAALAAPIVLLLGALLASADVVFASVVDVHISLPDDLAGHVALFVVGALAIGGVLRAASASPSAPLPELERRLGHVEWTIVLTSVVVLFAGFAAAQVVTLLGGARHVLETEGLTYAEYARTGYIQLLVAAVLTGLMLAGLGAVAARPTPRLQQRFTMLAEATVVLTAVVLAVAVRRLGLYEDAYGWTMLRLVAKAGAVWLGVVLVLFAVRLAGVGRDRDWFVPAALAAGVTVVAVLNLINPEAAIARHNLHDASHEVDPAYLAALSDDAVPTIVDALPSVLAARRPELLRAVCADREVDDSVLGWNRSARRADSARARVCSG